MNSQALLTRAREWMREPMPLPASGATSDRHRRLIAVGRENLSLAKLLEAHWDALAILAESGRTARAGVLYAVWASERPGRELVVERVHGGLQISGQKMFLSGAGLCDRALVTVGPAPGLLVDIDLRANVERIAFDASSWKARAFAETCTATGKFDAAWVDDADVLGDPGWYVARPGFWHGACGPAACWAGGAAGLLDFALQQKRDDAHTMAHLGAMRAEVWGMEAALDAAGREIDADGGSAGEAMVRALTVRHLVESACTETLRRITRAYGPAPLAMDEEFAQRCDELNLYVRQSHAERDLEQLGRGLRRDA